MMKKPDWFGPETVIAAVVATLGVLLALNDARYYELAETLTTVVVALMSAGIIAISRLQPGLALTLVWAMALAHLVSGVPVILVELSFVIVAFTCARWGRPTTLVASALSIPAFAGLILVLSSTFGYLPLSALYTYDRFVTDVVYSVGTRSAYVGLALLGLTLLGVPWLIGLALRFSDRAADSQVGQALAEEETERAHREAEQAQRESEQAREIAGLRDGQARLARDVHDVVGHSLAVILAQAESAQFLPDADTAKLKQTMATIATSARSSLQDVRHVLTTAAGDESPAATTRALDTLIDGVRTSGHEVVSRELGPPQPLPPDLEVVAYRVLQEMLTNAIKHGSRDEPVVVERLWPDGSWAGELRIEVRNSLAARPAPGSDETQPVTSLPPTPVSAAADDGRGLDGMRRRLEACGGRLDVRRRDGAHPDEAATFTTTAWVPVRTVSP